MDWGYLTKIMFGSKQLPENRVLIDPHAHFHRSLDPNEIVDALFERNVSGQAICDYGLANGNPEHVISYNEFVDRLKSEKDFEIIPSKGNTKIRRKNDNKRLILFQGREMETEVEGSSGGLFHNKHLMHIVVYGMTPDYNSAEEILKEAKAQHKHRIIAHPYTIPARNVEFVYASKEERDNVVRLSRKYGAALEGLNGTNSLWMTPTNLMVVETARREKLNLVYASDAHARLSLELTREQIGTAGTAVKRTNFNQIFESGGLNEIYRAMINDGIVFGRVQSPRLFYKVMIRPRLENMLKRE